MLFSHEKEENTSICDNMAEPRGHYTKSQKDKYHMTSLTCGILKYSNSLNARKEWCLPKAGDEGGNRVMLVKGYRVTVMQYK